MSLLNRLVVVLLIIVMCLCLIGGCIDDDTDTRYEGPVATRDDSWQNGMSTPYKSNDVYVTSEHHEGVWSAKTATPVP